MISDQHRRTANGNTITDYRPPQKVISKRTIMTAAIAFACVFSVMAILLVFTFSGKSVLASRLSDMTELYNYVNTHINYQTNHTAQQKPVTPNTSRVQAQPRTSELPITALPGINFPAMIDFSFPQPQVCDDCFSKLYIFTWSNVPDDDSAETSLSKPLETAFII